MHPMAQRLIDEYLEAAGHRDDQKGPLFRPIKINITGTLLKPLDPQALRQKKQARGKSDV